ncbi:unnamed protein product, partial [Echinostoma caproni]|uniref:FtsH_ext domain-containing protein n=1 Tax=Echinostoma caproni TaxID=27848 RepID=A0A183A2I2_9TREM
SSINPKFGSGGSNRARTEQQSSDQSNGNANRRPKLSPVRFFILLVSAGLTFFAGYALTHNAPYVMDMQKFMYLLERGEVQSIVLHPRRRFAIVKLHTPLREAGDKVSEKIPLTDCCPIFLIVFTSINWYFAVLHSFNGCY